MEPNFDCHKTEYQRLASTSRRREHRSRALSTSGALSTTGKSSTGPNGRLNTGGSEVSWKFTGKPFTTGISNREIELKKGCGIFPRVWPDEDSRISEVPVTCRRDLRFGTTALAAHGGIIPRMDKIDVDVDRYKRQLTTWHEHDHGKSSAAKKQLRPLRVAGLSSARQGYIAQPPSSRVGTQDRPEWIRGETDLPGGYDFTPSDPGSLLPLSARGRGDPVRFGIDAHFTAGSTRASQVDGFGIVILRMASSKSALSS